MQGTTAGGTVGAEHRVGAVECEVDDLARAGSRHRHHLRIGGVEHRPAIGSHVLDDDALEHGHILQGGDVVQAQVIAAADVGDHGHRAAVEPESLTQQTAAGSLQHRGLHIRMGQHVAGAFGAAAVTAVDGATVHPDTVGVGHAHRQPGAGHQVCDQAGDGGLAVGAGDGHHRDAAVVARRVQLADDGLTHRPGLAVGGSQVHAQARGGVDLHHPAALLFQRLHHVLRHHVDAADVQAHHAGRGHGAGGHIGVDVVGDVGGGAAGGQVGVVAQGDASTLLRHILSGQSLQRQAGQGNLVDADAGQGRSVPVTAPRVGIDLAHQLLDAVHAVADHMRRIAPGGGHQAVAHHQHAVVLTGQEALNHRRADLGGHPVGHLQVLAALDVDGHALALVAVQRLDHHRQAELLGRRPGFFQAVHRAAQRHRHPGGLQQILGEVLVLRDGFTHGTGGVHLRRPDAALLVTPAELHQAAVGEPSPGDVAGHRGVHDGAGAGAQTHVLVDGTQLGDGGFGIKKLVQPRRIDQRLRLLHRLATHGLLGVLHHHLVEPGFHGGLGAAEADGAAGGGLQGEGGDLQHLGQGGGARLHQVGGPVLSDGGEQRPDARLEGPRQRR